MRSLILAAALCAPALAHADTIGPAADLTDVNRPVPAGLARPRLDPDADALRVRITPSGLAPDQVHVRGAGRGEAAGAATGGGGMTPGKAPTPTLARRADAEGDGVLDQGAGVLFDGPILFRPGGGAPGLDGVPAAPGGVIEVDVTRDPAATPAFAAGFGRSDAPPLDPREIVNRGAFLRAGDGAAGATLIAPALDGEPRAAGWLLVAGLGALAVLRRAGTEGAVA
jgi:hypothetical protein